MSWVVGNVVTRGNPLMEAILDRGERYVSGPQWLAEHVLAGQHVLAVAGTHGKTTDVGDARVDPRARRPLAGLPDRRRADRFPGLGAAHRTRHSS